MRLDLFSVISASESVILELDCSPHSEALVCDARTSLPKAFLKQKEQNPEISSEIVAGVVVVGYAMPKGTTQRGEGRRWVETETRGIRLSS
jgi:hypothetical protein